MFIQLGSMILVYLFIYTVEHLLEALVMLTINRYSAGSVVDIDGIEPLHKYRHVLHGTFCVLALCDFSIMPIDSWFEELQEG